MVSGMRPASTAIPRPYDNPASARRVSKLWKQDPPQHDSDHDTTTPSRSSKLSHFSEPSRPPSPHRTTSRGIGFDSITAKLTRSHSRHGSYDAGAVPGRSATGAQSPASNFIPAPPSSSSRMSAVFPPKAMSPLTAKVYQATTTGNGSHGSRGSGGSNLSLDATNRSSSGSASQNSSFEHISSEFAHSSGTTPSSQRVSVKSAGPTQLSFQPSIPETPSQTHTGSIVLDKRLSNHGSRLSSALQSPVSMKPPVIEAHFRFSQQIVDDPRKPLDLRSSQTAHLLGLRDPPKPPSVESHTRPLSQIYEDSSRALDLRTPQPSSGLSRRHTAEASPRKDQSRADDITPVQRARVPSDEPPTLPPKSSKPIPKNMRSPSPPPAPMILPVYLPASAQAAHHDYESHHAAKSPASAAHSSRGSNDSLQPKATHSRTSLNTYVSNDSHHSARLSLLRPPSARNSDDLQHTTKPNAPLYPTINNSDSDAPPPSHSPALVSPRPQQHLLHSAEPVHNETTPKPQQTKTQSTNWLHRFTSPNPPSRISSARPTVPHPLPPSSTKPSPTKSFTKVKESPTKTPVARSSLSQESPTRSMSAMQNYDAPPIVPPKPTIVTSLDQSTLPFPVSEESTPRSSVLRSQPASPISPAGRPLSKQLGFSSLYDQDQGAPPPTRPESKPSGYQSPQAVVQPLPLRQSSSQSTILPRSVASPAPSLASISVQSPIPVRSPALAPQSAIDDGVPARYSPVPSRQPKPPPSISSVSASTSERTKSTSSRTPASTPLSPSQARLSIGRMPTPTSISTDREGMNTPSSFGLSPTPEPIRQHSSFFDFFRIKPSEIPSSAPNDVWIPPSLRAAPMKVPQTPSKRGSAPIPIPSTPGRKSPGQVSNKRPRFPFRLFGKRNRSVSQASLEAVMGTGVPGSPTQLNSSSSSIRTTTPGLPSPPARDPVQAVADWRKQEEEELNNSGRKRRRRPGVTFDFPTDPSEEHYTTTRLSTIQPLEMQNSSIAVHV